MTSRLEQYFRYHKESARIGDIDPSYAMLKYVANRFELSIEQRYWIAFLYALTYNGASTFYIGQEFPDYENVDIHRMQRWWDTRGRDEMMVQTDRRWVRSSDMFVDAVASYQWWVGDRPQHEHFMEIATGDTAEERYDRLYADANQLYSFGQFALFLYLEALHTITPLDLMPTDLNLDKAWSCRNGLYYAYDLDHWIEDTESRIIPEAWDETAARWKELRAALALLETPPTIWQTETILCAFRKWFRGKRWIGYYLDRQCSEIIKMEEHVWSGGVCFDVLYQYREETYDHEFLAEKHGGPSKEWKNWGIERTRLLLEEADSLGR